MAGSLAQGWSNPLPSLLPVASPEEDESSSDGNVASPEFSPPEYGFGPPLNTRKEASYLMHFIHELAPWFDVCDAARHFGTEVPKRARHFPFLAYSILAFSSRQMSLKEGIRDDSHEAYHSHALRILIPILDDPIGAVNENVLAGIVILRSYEEMTGKPTKNADGGAHLTGSSRLLNSEFRFAAQGGLGEAASWVVLRQDMDSQSFVDTSDESLANRVVFICGRVLAYAFGPDSRLDPALWVQLGEDLRGWYEATPWKVLSCAPEAVPGREQLQMQEAVRDDLRMLLGLTISNPNLPTAYFTAHHTLYACGVYLKDQRERQEVFRFLEDMSNNMGWPTREVAAQLRKDWSMEKRTPGKAPSSPHTLGSQGFSGPQVWEPKSGVWGNSPVDKQS
ncbi:hypothetical protein ACJZ2D_016313 [Fusarium nematophilum]